MHLYCTCTKQKKCYDITFSSQGGSTVRHLANGGNLAGHPGGDTKHVFQAFSRTGFAGSMANCPLGKIY